MIYLYINCGSRNIIKYSLPDFQKNIPRTDKWFRSAYFHDQILWLILSSYVIKKLFKNSDRFWNTQKEPEKKYNDIFMNDMLKIFIKPRNRSISEKTIPRKIESCAATPFNSKTWKYFVKTMYYYYILKHS